MTVPITKDEIMTFTPEALANLPAPPVFLFRPKQRGEKRTWSRKLAEAGLRIHSDEAIRAEMIRALNELWSEDVREANIARLRNVWASIDQKVEIDSDEIVQAARLTEEVMKVWAPLRSMSTDNAQFYEDAPKIALGMFLVGWRNFDVPFVRVAGEVELELIDEVQETLLKVEQEAFANGVANVIPGKGFDDLVHEAFNLLGLTKAEEKKSELPSPSPSSLTPLKESPRPAAAGSSEAEPKPKNTRKTRSA